jgi:putative ABC transport system permease protein
VVVSHRLWSRRFGAASAIGDRRLRVGASSYSIVGVMPASFRFPVGEVDVWMAAPVDAPYAQSRRATWLTVVGRLRPSVTLAEAEADLNTVQRQLGAQFPDPDARLRVDVHALKDVVVGDVGRSLWMLFGAVSLLLLIACTNIAALLLARASDRRHEIAIRYSMGASRAAIVRQLLAEALALSLGGAVLGLLVAVGAFRVFATLAGDLPRIAELGLDWTLVGYSLACAVGATLLFGLLPALRGARQHGDAMRPGANRTVVQATGRLQWLLVGVQIALAVTLLAGAGLLVRSFEALGRVSPGFESAHLLTFRISGNYGETSDMPALTRRIDGTLDVLQSVPGVSAAATALAAPGTPFQHETEMRFTDGDNAGHQRIVANTRVVSAGYFAAVRIPLLSGELCRQGSDVSSAVVNRTFAALYSPGASPIGRSVDHVPSNGFLRSARIVGVVGDAREEGPSREPAPTVYWCRSAPAPAPLFLVRTIGDPTAMADTIRRKVRELEPGRSVYDIAALDDRLGESLAENRMRTTLLTSFAVIALLLAALGLYGTLSYIVSMRRREIGVRMAVGASRGHVASSFLAQGLRVSAVGCAAGLWLAAVFGQALSGMLFGVSPHDVPTLAGVVLLMGVVATVASVWPAMRAARTEPIRVLRDE